MIDLINDEDMHIQLDAIEAFTEILEELTIEEVEKEFVPCVLSNLDLDNHAEQIDLLDRISQLCGLVAFKLSERDDIHLTHKQEFLEFYLHICDHKEVSIRKRAIYNLPAMHKLFKSEEKDFGFTFQELYEKFSQDDEWDIRFTTLCSLHEAFKLIEDDDDTTVLRRVFIDFVLDGNEQIQIQLNKTISEIILRYANTDTVKNFKGRTPYIEPEPSQNLSGKNSKDTTP